MTMSSYKFVNFAWDDAKAATLDPVGRLVYRSNLLGSDLRITNFGGGNTSAKVPMTDPLTRQEVTVLWVKGSGGDIGSMGLDGFVVPHEDAWLNEYVPAAHDRLLWLTGYTGTFDELRDAMSIDKKSRGSQLRFVVLDDLARPRILAGPSEDDLRASYDAISGGLS